MLQRCPIQRRRNKLRKGLATDFLGIETKSGASFRWKFPLPTKKTSLRGLVVLPCDSPFWNWRVYGVDSVDRRRDLRWQENVFDPIFFWKMVSRTAHFHFQKFCNSKVRMLKKIILVKDKMMHQLGCIKTLLQESEACDLSTGTGFQQL